MKVISRKDAKALGLTRYFTGKLCKYGHIDERLVTNFACVTCHRNRVYAYYEKHPEIKKAYLKQWNKDNPECSQRWSLAHPEEVKARKKIAKQRWSQENPEKKNTAWRNYHARKNKAEGHHSGEDVIALYKKQKGKCNACGAKLGKSYHVDHVIPLFRGGSNWPSNLQLLCASCNSSKGSKTMEEWFALAS